MTFLPVSHRTPVDADPKIHFNPALNQRFLFPGLQFTTGTLLKLQDPYQKTKGSGHKLLSSSYVFINQQLATQQGMETIAAWKGSNLLGCKLCIWAGHQPQALHFSIRVQGTIRAAGMPRLGAGED
jgi:hypothetical protein